MQANCPYDLVIGLDRSDRKADLHVLDTRTGSARKQMIETAPERLQEWLAQLRAEHPQARVAVGLEQRQKGSGHHAAVRALAYKWQRVIWNCWQDRKPYDEAVYEAALRRRGSLVAGLLDQIEVGKSPLKILKKKTEKPLAGSPQR